MTREDRGARPAFRRAGTAAGAFTLLAATTVAAVQGRDAVRAPAPDIQLFFAAASADHRRAEAALRALEASWKDAYAPLLVDLARFMRPPQSDAGAEPVDPDAVPGPDSAFGAPVDPSTAVRRRLIAFLEKRTGKRFGHDLRAWRRWMWTLPEDPHPDLLAFKGLLYGRVDPRMADFFAPGSRSLIRLDEIDWGGVGVNGIPPLDHAKVVAAADARWLKDDHVVFGIAVNGEARAYPKRILAWHELARDRVGGVELAIVYCTLCGTVVPYRAETGGRTFTFGTSGLLYRSNKLLFDEETKSLWNSTTGRPVVGRLAGSGLELRFEPVVTTTWGEWRAAHPRTAVVDRETGHRRDYAEGAAYRDYFATDELMFEVQRSDRRLRNKAEVLGILLAPAGAEGAERKALAVAADLLLRRRVYDLVFAGRSLVVVTSAGGANRVYATDGRRFAAGAQGRLVDAGGRTWAAHEDGLRMEDGGLESFPRVPARRAFWFAWQAQFPDTELAK